MAKSSKKKSKKTVIEDQEKKTTDESAEEALNTEETKTETEEVKEENKDEAAKDEDVVSEESEKKKESPKAKRKLNWRVWQWPKKAKLTILVPAIIILLGGVGFAIPSTRYAIQNVYSSASLIITVTDQSTGQPLAGVTVTTGQRFVETGEDGIALFEDMSFGSDVEVQFKKDSYQSNSATYSIEGGDVEGAAMELIPIGIPFTINATDKITGDTIENFSVVLESDQENSIASEGGEALLNLPQGTKKINVVVSADNFNEVSIELEADEETSTVELVPSGRTYFLSNRSGTIDVIGANYDGSDREVIVEGTGDEQVNTFLYTSPDGKYAVLRAPRNGERNEDGGIINELYVIDFANKSIELFDEGAERWTIVEVLNDKVIYTIDKGDRELDDNRKIKTYSFESKQLNTLYAADDLDEIRYAEGYIFLEDVEYRWPEPTSADFYRFDIDTGERIQLESRHYIYNLRVVSPGVIHYNRDSSDSSDEGWIEYNVASNQATELDIIPNEPSRSYNQSPNGQRLAWLENLDGKQTLKIGDQNAQNEGIVPTELNINGIVRWVSEDLLVVLINTEQEHAHYIVSVNGGGFIKVADVYEVDYTGFYGYNSYY